MEPPAAPPSLPLLMRRAEVAEILRVGRRKVSELIDQGKLEMVQLDASPRSLRVLGRSVERLIAEQRAGPEEIARAKAVEAARAGPATRAHVANAAARKTVARPPPEELVIKRFPTETEK